MNPATDRRHEDFATTRWSLVMQLEHSRSPDGRSALAELCLRSWYPIYAYVRRCDHPPAIAQDITKSFLQHLLRHFRDRDEPLPHEHFRRFLLVRLNAFLAGDWRETGEEPGSVELAEPPPDLERRNQHDNAGATSAEQAYQRSFALEVIARAFKRLRAEARHTGHLDMYEALEPFLTRDPGPGEYEELARVLHSRSLALVVALKRLRQRFRELVGEELADTVTSAEELAAEQEALHAALRELS